jgi:hypothetical protein
MISVDYAALFGAGDGEAMCFALAESRGHPIAIDDERAIRRAKKRNPNFETRGTLEILMRWQERKGMAHERMGEWAKCSSRSSDTPDPDLPHPIPPMSGGSGAGRSSEGQGSANRAASGVLWL